MDPRLEYIPDRVKQLTREVSDAEWEGDPRAARLAKELQHYKEKQAKGELYEPKF